MHLQVPRGPAVDRVCRNFRTRCGGAGAGMPDDLAGRHVQGREQGGGAVALVVVGHRAAPGPASSAATAGSGPAPGSGTSRPCTARSPSRAGSDTDPTTSMSLSSNCGSLDTLNVSTRCGCNPSSDQIRCTVAELTPPAWPSCGTTNAWPVRSRCRGQPHDLVDRLLGDRGLAATTFADLLQPGQARPRRTADATPAPSPASPRPPRRS